MSSKVSAKTSPKKISPKKAPKVSPILSKKTSPEVKLSPPPMPGTTGDKPATPTPTPTPTPVVKKPITKRIHSGYQTVDDIKNVDQVTHVYDRPDMYAGSDKKVEHVDWTYDLTTGRMTEYTVSIPQVVERLFLEILSNAGDAVNRAKIHGVNTGPIYVTMTNTNVTIRNGGFPVPIGKKQTKDGEIWGPELVFGTLLSGTNYDDEVIRTGCGRNGLGAKLVNIMSTHFAVRIGDSKQKKLYTQEWDGPKFLKVYEPVITDYDEESFVEVSYDLDFQRFDYEEYPDEAWHIFARYCADMSLAVKVPIHFINGLTDEEYIIDCTDIKTYSKLYFNDVESAIIHVQYPLVPHPELKKKDLKFFPEVELCALYTPDNQKTISMVNGMITKEHGVHVDEAYRAIAEIFLEKFKNDANDNKKSKDKKAKLPTLNIRDVLPHITIVMNCFVWDPVFTSQSKSCFASPAIKIGFNKSTIDTFRKWELSYRLEASLKAKDYKSLIKTDGKKSKYIGKLKGDDAIEAGGENSRECVLYLVEGDSAAKYAQYLIDLIPNGKKYYGFFPLKGKPLNVRNASLKMMLNNKEHEQLKKVLGLVEGADYSDEKVFDNLRYGKIISMVDADCDGKHILGLMYDFFEVRWPSLLKRDFVYIYRSPIIRVVNGKNKLRFFSILDFNEWKEKNKVTNSMTIDYFKGMGSSKNEHIMDDFNNQHIVKSLYDDMTENTLRLAFDGKLADDRKKWIANWAQSIKVENMKTLPITTYIKEEFVQYCIANIERSIPRLSDGLKVSQRKILWTVYQNTKFKNSKPRKVDVFCGEVTSITKYHHGAKSLEGAIVGMAQDFVGSNNMPYLTRDGQYGSRKDPKAASSRYISTSGESWLRYVYKEEDMNIMTILEDEGDYVEPDTFLPIIPMVLINGSTGISTGWSSNVPCHNPKDICKNLKMLINGQTPTRMKPWYRGFTGKIEFKEIDINKMRDENLPSDNNENEENDENENEEEYFEGSEIKDINGKVPSIVTKGIFEVDPKGLVHITELPIGRWTKDYHDWLDDMITEKKIKSFEDHSKTTNINIKIKGMNDPGFDTLKLTKSYGMNNMVLLDEKNRPVRYNSANHILEEFYKYRLPFYEKRKQNILNCIQEEIDKEVFKARYIKLFNDKVLVTGVKRDILKKTLTEQKIPYDIAVKVSSVNLTTDGYQECMDEIEKLKIEKKRIEDYPSKQMWIDDIDGFLKFYNKEFK